MRRRSISKFGHLAASGRWFFAFWGCVVGVVASDRVSCGSVYALVLRAFPNDSVLGPELVRAVV